MDYTIRPGKKEDMSEMMTMIQELATYQNHSKEPIINAEVLIKDGFGEKPLFDSYIMEKQNLDKPVGYAICYDSYSAFKGKTMFLLNLYIRPNHRGKRLGEKLFKHIVKVAYDRNCFRLEFHCLRWNPARKMYEKLGAVNCSEPDGDIYYNLSREKMEEMFK